MSNSFKIAGIMFIVAAVAAIIVLVEKLNAANETIAALNRNPENVAAGMSAKSVPTEAPANRSRLNTVAPQPPADGLARPRRVANVPQIRGNPAFAVARRVEMQRLVESNYGLILAELSLDPETLRKVKTILAEQATAIDDARDVLAKQPGHNRALVSKAEAQASEPFENEIRSILGARYSELNELRQLQDEFRGIRGSVGADLEYAGYPLTLPQRLELAKIMAKYNYAFSPTGVSLRRSVGENEQVADAVASDAANVLTPQQMSVFRQAQLAKRQREELMSGQIVETRKRTTDDAE